MNYILHDSKSKDDSKFNSLLEQCFKRNVLHFDLLLQVLITHWYAILDFASGSMRDLLLLLSCVNCHICRLVDASQVRVSSSRSVKPLSPFGGLCIVQSSMMCCTDWFGAPHSHSEVDFRPHLFMASPPPMRDQDL